MENLCVVDQFHVQLVVAQAGVCAGLAGEGEFAVAGLVQRDESEGGENVIGHDDAGGSDAGLIQRADQELAESVVADLTQQCCGSAELCQSCEEIGGCAAGMGCHGGIAFAVLADTGEIDEQFAHCYDIIHSE